MGRVKLARLGRIAAGAALAFGLLQLGVGYAGGPAELTVFRGAFAGGHLPWFEGVGAAQYDIALFIGMLGLHGIAV